MTRKTRLAVELDESHSTLHQSPGDQALGSEPGGVGLIEPVESLDGF